MTKELRKKLQEYFVNHWDKYKYYLWLYWLDFRYNLDLSIKDRDLANIAGKLYLAYKKKKQRIRNMVEYMIRQTNNNLWFITLTFSNEYVNLPHKEIKEMFKDFKFVILNEDFGKTTQRRHYHAIIDGESLHNLSWCYGFYCFKKINISEKSLFNITRYIIKLVQHSIKRESKQIFYSKSIRFFNRK